MTTKIKQGGFTIIEVMLFLGVTGLLLLIALIGTGGTIATARFGDSIRSTESFIEQQGDLILNGANLRPDTLKCEAGRVSEGDPTKPGTSDDCVIMGKLLFFTEGEDFFRVYDILGVPPRDDSGDNGELALILKYDPAVVLEASQISQYDINWEATVFNVLRKNRDADTSVNAIAMVRGPLSSSIYNYAFSWSQNRQIKSYLEDINNFIGDTNSALVCIQSADNNSLAGIKIGGGQGPANVTASFDLKPRECRP